MPPLKQEDRRVWRYILYVVGEVLSNKEKVIAYLVYVSDKSKLNV